MYLQWRVAQKWHYDHTRIIHQDTKDPIAAFKKDDLKLKKTAAAVAKAALKESASQAAVQVIFNSEVVLNMMF